MTTTTTIFNRMDYLNLKVRDGETIQYLVPDTDSETTEPTINDIKIGRNELCLCGSGKKFKNCCLLNKK